MAKARTPELGGIVGPAPGDEALGHFPTTLGQWLSGDRRVGCTSGKSACLPFTTGARLNTERVGHWRL